MAASFRDPVYEKLAQRYESEFGLPNGILAAIRMGGEKSNSDQVSPKGARGVYQFMPATWRAYSRSSQRGDEFITNPDAATYAAANYVRDAIDNAYADAARFKVELPRERLIQAVFAEYNGGPNQRRKVVKGEFEKLPTETRDYIFGNAKTPTRAQAVFDQYNGLVAVEPAVPSAPLAPADGGALLPQLSDLQIAAAPEETYADVFGIASTVDQDYLNDAAAETVDAFGLESDPVLATITREVDRVFADE